MKKFRLNCGWALVCILFFTAATVSAMEGLTPEDQLARMNELMQQQDWLNAQTVGESLVEHHPDRGEGWILLGITYRNLGQYEQAAAAATAAVELDYQPARSLTSLAIANALAGNTSEAFVALNEAVNAGLPSSVIETHAGLADLREDPRYPTLLETAERLSYPCEHEERYRAMDFWLGDWDVVSGGQPAGRNRISKTQRGCIVHESWTSATGTSGESMNFIDPVTGQWNQRWVDSNGGIVWYKGGLDGENMHMVGERIDARGDVTRTRVTLFPNDDGTLRHLIEDYDPVSDSWSPSFDAVYRPRAEPEN